MSPINFAVEPPAPIMLPVAPAGPTKDVTTPPKSAIAPAICHISPSVKPPSDPFKL